MDPKFCLQNGKLPGTGKHLRRNQNPRIPTFAGQHLPQIPYCKIIDPYPLIKEYPQTKEHIDHTLIQAQTHFRKRRNREKG